MLYKLSYSYKSLHSENSIRTDSPNIDNLRWRSLNLINKGFAKPYRSNFYKCNVVGVGESLASKTLTKTFVLPNKSKQLNQKLIQVLRLLLQNNYSVSSVIATEKDYPSYSMIKAPELQKTKLDSIKCKSNTQVGYVNMHYLTVGVEGYKPSMYPLNLTTFKKKSLLQNLIFKASQDSFLFNKKASLQIVSEQKEISASPNHNYAFPVKSDPSYTNDVRGVLPFSIAKNPSIFELGSKSFLNQKTPNQRDFGYGPPKAAQYWLLPFLGFYCLLSNETTQNNTFFDSNLNSSLQLKLIGDKHNQLSDIGGGVNKPMRSDTIASFAGYKDFLVEPSRQAQNESSRKEANELEQLALFYLNRIGFMREAPISAKTKTQAYTYGKTTPTMSAETFQKETVMVRSAHQPIDKDSAKKHLQQFKSFVLDKSYEHESMVNSRTPRTYVTGTLLQDNKPLFYNQDFFINSFYTAVDFYKSYFKTCWYNINTFNTNTNFAFKNECARSAPYWECLLTSKKTANFNTLQLEDSTQSSVLNIGVTPFSISAPHLQKTKKRQAPFIDIAHTSYGAQNATRDVLTTNYVTVKGQALCNNWIFEKSKKENALKSKFLETNNKKRINFDKFSLALISSSKINNSSTDNIGCGVLRTTGEIRNDATHDNLKLTQNLSNNGNNGSFKLAQLAEITTPVNDYKKLGLVLDNLIQSYNWNFLGSSRANLLHILRYAPIKKSIYGLHPSYSEGLDSKSGLHPMLGYCNLYNSLTSENKETAYLEKLKEQNILLKSKQFVTKDIVKMATSALSFNQKNTVQSEAAINVSNRSLIKRAFNGNLDSTFSLFQATLACSNMSSNTAELAQNNIKILWQQETVLNSLNSLQVKGVEDLTHSPNHSTVFPKGAFIKLKSPLLTSSNFVNKGKHKKTHSLLTSPLMNSFRQSHSEHLKQESGLLYKKQKGYQEPTAAFDMWRWRSLNLEKDTAYLHISNSSKTRKTDAQQNAYGIKQSSVQTISEAHIQKKPWDITQSWLVKPYENATLVSSVGRLAEPDSSEYKAAPIFRHLQNYVKYISGALESKWSSLQFSGAMNLHKMDSINIASNGSRRLPLLNNSLNTILKNYKPTVGKSFFAPVDAQQKSDVDLNSMILDMPSGLLPLKHKKKTIKAAVGCHYSLIKKNKFNINGRMPIRNSLGKPIISIVLQHKKFMFLKANITENQSNRDLFKQEKTYIEGKKAIQKKLKAKKQRLENRYQKKRKRFYPRPTWFRLRLGYSFLALRVKTKTNTIHNNSFLKAENKHKVFNQQSLFDTAKALRALYKPSADFIDTPYNIKGSANNFKIDKWESALNTANASNLINNLWFSNKKHSSQSAQYTVATNGSNSPVDSALTTKQKLKNYYAWQLCSSQSQLNKKKATYGCFFAKKNFLLSRKMLLKIKNKNSKSYASFENKSANSVPQKKDKSSNLIRDFWIWLYNITNKAGEPWNSNLLLKNLLKNLSIPVDLNIHPRGSLWLPKGGAYNNYTNLGYVTTTNGERSAPFASGALTETLPWQQVAVNPKKDNKGLSSTNELSGDSWIHTNAPLQQSGSPKTIGTSQEGFGSNTAKNKLRYSPAYIDQSYSDRAIAYNSNTKNLIRIRWALNKTNLWASTNKRLDLWSTQKLRNQSKNNKTKFIEKQLKKQINNFFSSVYFKDFIKKQKRVAKDGFDLDPNSKISATQLSFAKAKSVAKSNINQKIHQKEQKLLYLTNLVSEKIGSKLNTKKLNTKMFSLNTMGTQQINSKQPTVALLNQFSKQNPLYNKISLNFVSKPYSEFNFLWYKTGFFDGIGSGTLNKFLTSDQIGKIGSVPLPVNMYNAYVLTGQNNGMQSIPYALRAYNNQALVQPKATPIAENETLFKHSRSDLAFTNTVTSVSMVALLFHFCALISLISISQIRSFLQFHLILIHKLSNLYLQIINGLGLRLANKFFALTLGLRALPSQQNLSNLTKKASYVTDTHGGLWQPQTKKTGFPRSGYKAYLTEESNQGLKRPIKGISTFGASIVDNVSISKSLKKGFQKNYKTLKTDIKNYLTFNGLSYKVFFGIKQKFQINSFEQNGSKVGLSLNSNVAQARARSKPTKMLKDSLRSASLNTNQKISIRSLLESFVLQKTFLLEKSEKISQATLIDNNSRLSMNLKNVSGTESKRLDNLSKLTRFLFKIFLFNWLNRKTPQQTNKQLTAAQSNLIQKGKTKSAVGGLESFSALDNKKVLRNTLFKQNLNIHVLSNQYKLKVFKTQSINTVKKVTFETGFKIVDTFESFLRLIYSFFEKPAEFTMDWVAFAFLVEWSSDRIAYTPEKNSKNTWIAFSKVARQNKSFGVWFSLFYGTNVGTAALSNPNLIENYGFFSTPATAQQSDLLSKLSNPIFSIWILTLSQFFYKRVLYLNDMFLDLLNRPDTDLLSRQRKGTLFWDIWSDVLIKAADKYNINVPSLSNIKEEQNLLIDRFLTEPNTIATPGFPLQKLSPKPNRIANIRSALFTTALLQGRNLSVKNTSQQTTVFKKSYMDYDKRSLSYIQLLMSTHYDKRSLQDGLESTSSNSGFLSQELYSLSYNPNFDANKLNLSDMPNQTKVAFGGQEDTDLFSAKDINQFVTYQSKETDLFIDYHPTKALNHINSIKYYNFAAMPQTIGTLVCQIYSGIFNKQIAKNVLVISHGSGKNIATVGGSVSNGSIVADTALERMQKTLLIQALAGETEMKIITDNASRYAIVNRGFAVGIKLLKDVFEALSLNTPCFFLLEDIHLIGERRPFLISDHGDSFGDDMSKASETAFGAQSNGSSGGAQAVHEKNQVYYQLSRHGITHYKKPFKGDVSLSIPTNHFSFDLFLKTRYSNFSLHRTITNPLASTLNYDSNHTGGNSNQNSESILKSVVQKLTSKRSLSGQSTGQNSTLIDATGGLLSSYLQLAVSQKNSSEEELSATSFGSSIAPRIREAKRGALNKTGYSSKGGAAAPPQTGSNMVLLLKEQKRLKPKKTVKELPWIGLPTEQFALLPRVSYSVRAKVAALADLAFSNMSAKLDMITDLLVIIDSVRGNRGFVVFGTTHLPHILDPALRRPGRFDETISIPTLPNLWNRWEFIKASQPIIAPEFFSHKSYNSIAYYDSIIPSRGAPSTSLNPLNKLTAGSVYNSNTILAYHGTLDYLDFLNLDFIPNNNKNLFSSLVTRFKKNANAKKSINLQKTTLIKRGELSYADTKLKLDMQKKYSKMSHVAYSQMGKKVITNTYVYNLSNITPVYNNPKTVESSVALTETVEFLSNQNQYTSLYGSTTMLRNTLLSLISGKLSSSFALKNKPIRLLRSKGVELENLETRTESPILQKPFNTFKAFVKQNLCSLYGIDQTWRAVTTLAFSFVQKRYLYHKNLIVPKLLNFTDSSPLEEPPSPPISNLLIPAKRYENYKKAFKENISFGSAQRKVTNTIQEKIEAHTKQAYIKSIYNTNKNTQSSQLAGKSKSKRVALNTSYGLSNNINSLAVLKLAQQTNVGNLGVSQHPLRQTSSVNWYYQQKILQRHRNYLKNQWWNGQLTEHSAETLFLSDIDWRYTFIENLNSQNFLKTKVQFFETLKLQNKIEIESSGFIEPRPFILQKEQLQQSQLTVYGMVREAHHNTTQDIVIDFPDADQHYNPKHRRWLITAGYWGSWFSFDKNLQTEIFEHLIFESFVKSYNILNKNRELLDYSASKFIKKGLIKELHIHNNIRKF